MANPAPTINQINAFNATQGTTIDFNIIGGTELVRSNRIYIYDLSDNSLICTHLYVSTESIHELPPNTDSSIVYESGKSSADFVNGAQYYAQIQTFTDIGGTEGGSGLSVAKMFWCLDDPTLTISTIPSTISTTSYNVSATYNANTSVVSNIIQQYQFSLYSATGSLLQSSGVVVGNGEQQGTSTAYDISYNFTGLSVGSSYYVVVDVTTTQGMSVSTQSGTFTVSIDTPTLGEATVVNNACDGYISVTSNLSSEYGGSGSGDIVSFETDSENVFTKLQVAIEATQSGSGTPSPSNVRPISGHTEVTVTVADDADDPTVSEDYTTALGQTVYGGTLDLVSGELTVTHGISTVSALTAGSFATGSVTCSKVFYLSPTANTATTSTKHGAVSSMGIEGKAYFASNRTSEADSANVGFAISTDGTYMRVYDADLTLTTSAFSTKYASMQICYPLATPLTYQLTPQQINTLVGVNNVWSEQGDVELAYHIPITDLLVKRQDVDDVSGNWLTLYSQPVEQASDMDFTFIDFLNQYGKTYKYALVPLLTQTQSGVEVEVEGGYTVSDEVQSIFDGVFISDSTGSQKCKANVGYGNVNMNQSVGSITPIGSQYPIIVTNSNNRYHNGSISGMIVPDDYYYNGNLSRIDMVNKRNELEQFLTNKRAKIIKDWNSNIWLVMIMDNIDCSFDNNYGMGIVTFNANWLEVGDPTNQEDLQATGLVDVGGV